MHILVTSSLILLLTFPSFSKDKYATDVTLQEYQNIVFGLSSSKYPNDLNYTMTVRFNQKTSLYHINLVSNKLFIEEVKRNLQHYRSMINKIPIIKPVNTLKNIQQRKKLKQQIMANNLEGVETVLRKLKHVNFTYTNSYSPIYYAISSGNINIVNLLISSGADVNHMSQESTTPLHHAVKFGDINIIDLLIEEGAIVNSQDMYGRTPLHYATEKNYQEIIYYLLGKGANRYITDFGGEIPKF